MTYYNRNTINIQYFTDPSFRQINCGDQYNKGNNTYNHYNKNKNGYKLQKKKSYVCDKKSCCSNKHLDYEKQKAK